MCKKALGKSSRQGITLVQLMEMFPDEATAHAWFVRRRWGTTGRFCPRCNSSETQGTPGTMPYWCPSCRHRFSIRTGTVLERSKIPLRKWVIAIYLCATSLKGVSSMKLHRDLGITQKSAWFMLHRIREAMQADTDVFTGPVEVDETTIGGERKNMPKAKREQLTGSGAVGKTAVVGMKDRESNKITAEVVPNAKKPTLQRFVKGTMVEGSKIDTDENTACKGLSNHESVKHSVHRYVCGHIHTNGIESFWAMFKRAHKGTFHKMSDKHLQRYVTEFVSHHNNRLRDTIDIMVEIVRGMTGRRLCYGDLIADNGLDSGARG